MRFPGLILPARVAPLGRAPHELHTASIWHQLGAEYDVRNLTEAELRELGERLYSAGAISLPDRRMLTLHPDTRLPVWPRTPGGRHDWLSDTRAQLSEERKDSIHAAYLARLLEFLYRIDFARQELLAPVVFHAPACTVATR